MDRAEIAFWTAIRHLVRKAAGYAPDTETHRAYDRVLAHTEERVDHFLQVARGDAPSPTKPKAPAA